MQRFEGIESQIRRDDDIVVGKKPIDKRGANPAGCSRNNDDPLSTHRQLPSRGGVRGEFAEILAQGLWFAA